MRCVCLRIFPISSSFDHRLHCHPLAAVLLLGVATLRESGKSAVSRGCAVVGIGYRETRRRRAARGAVRKCAGTAANLATLDRPARLYERRTKHSSSRLVRFLVIYKEASIQEIRIQLLRYLCNMCRRDFFSSNARIN